MDAATLPERLAEQTPSWTVTGPPVRGRSCGACKACCVLVPVHLSADDYKAANERCRHACSKGCAVYAKRPEPCQVWSCAWLIQRETAGLRRPDLAGYVIDPMLDQVQAGEEMLDAVQVWADPARPDAHRDPALRAWLRQVGMPAIVRYSETDAFVLVPPHRARQEWLEIGAVLNTSIGNFARLTETERAAAAGVL